MTISGWILLLFAIPVLLLGEFLVKRVAFLSRYNIPAPVVGGLLVALLVLVANKSGVMPVQFMMKVDDPWWTWLISTETEWQRTPKLDVHRPLLVAFFTCIGLNASWSLARRGGVQMITFLVIASLFAVLQNGIGVIVAKMLDAPVLLGVACGAVTLTGGHATAMGFAQELEKAGLPSAGVIGAAAATFGLVSGGLIGGPVGGRLIKKFKLQSTARANVHLASGETAASGILNDFRALWKFGRTFLVHVVVLLVCIKLGAWVSYFIQEMKLTFPVYMGALLLGVLVRNVVDLSGNRWIKTEVVDTIGSVCLGVFLSVAMMGLNLVELRGTAGPMLIILAVQVVVMALFAFYVTYRAMGKDYDAAVMSAGHCGFGLGATPNAVANMKSLVETYGAAPRAFLVVPIVGAFLIDFANAINITFFINAVK